MTLESGGGVVVHSDREAFDRGEARVSSGGVAAVSVSVSVVSGECVFSPRCNEAQCVLADLDDSGCEWRCRLIMHRFFTVRKSC